MHYHEKNGVLRRVLATAHFIMLFCLEGTKQDLVFVISIVSTICLAIVILTFDLCLESNGAN